MKTREGIGKREEDLAFAAVSGIPGTKAYRNVYIPLRGGRTAEIDILLVSAKGVVAIEVKGFGGAITGSAVRWEWTRTRREKRSGGIERLKFYNPQSERCPFAGGLAIPARPPGKLPRTGRFLRPRGAQEGATEHRDVHHPADQVPSRGPFAAAQGAWRPPLPRRCGAHHAIN